MICFRNCYEILGYMKVCYSDWFVLSNLFFEYWDYIIMRIKDIFKFDSWEFCIVFFI